MGLSKLSYYHQVDSGVFLTRFLKLLWKKIGIFAALAIFFM